MAVHRVVEVAPARLSRWMSNFASRHGEYAMSPGEGVLTLAAVDGAVADIEPPFPPLPTNWADGDPVAGLVSHAERRRVVGVVLVRLGGFAAGIFDGADLTSSKVGARQVHGRSAAGGWSQQRFARRRAGQARVALAAAADAAAVVLLPELPRLDAVVTGGDKNAVRAVLGDMRLAAVAPLVVDRVLEVPDPKAKVLKESIFAVTAMRITLSEAG